MRHRVALWASILLGALSVGSVPARAAHNQVAMIQDIRVIVDPASTVAQFARLGAQQVRLYMLWNYIAPQSGSHRRPSDFNEADPAEYADAWSRFDQAVETIQRQGMRVNLDVGGGAPLWATGPHAPVGKPHPSWEPNARDFGAFVHAVGERYSGDYNPLTGKLDPGNPDDLPKVDFWSIWNEPNYGPSLAPQGLPDDVSIDHAPALYRGLVDAAWTALGQTGHRHDTILFGELAPRGYPGVGHPHFGLFSGMKPLPFLRSLYCLGAGYHPLHGFAAAIRGCPTSTAGYRRFRRRHPVLFAASGVAIHPYSRWYEPDREPPGDPDYASLADFGQLTATLDRIQRAYGSAVRFPIWNTEYGYQTSPPKHDSARFPWVSPSTAATYLNQAEYISWRNPRVSSFMQYLLYDGPARPTLANDWGGFATGLIAWNGVPKPTYAAWRLPVWMPVTTGRRGARLEVWGCARPAYFPLVATPGEPESVAVEWRPRGHSRFVELARPLITNPRGYFDVRVVVPGSGTVRLQWSDPAADPAPGAGSSAVSRDVTVSLH